MRTSVLAAGSLLLLLAASTFAEERPIDLRSPTKFWSYKRSNCFSLNYPAVSPQGDDAPALIDPRQMDIEQTDFRLIHRKPHLTPSTNPIGPELRLPDCKQPEQKQPDQKQPDQKQPDSKSPEAKQPNPQDQQANNPTVGATEAGTQPSATFNPYMFGDLLGASTTTQSSAAISALTGANGASGSLGAGRGNIGGSGVANILGNRGIPLTTSFNGFKISDNDTPRPVDRFYFVFNNFSEVARSSLPAGAPVVTVNRQLVGFEKTFWGGDASFGMRLPYIQTSGFDGGATGVIGDLNMIFKFAWINDRDTNDVLSSGLVLTAPTGNGTTILADGTTAPHPTLFQPWAGGIYNFRQGYVQAFTGVVVPSDRRDPTVLFNSIAAGYWLYRNSEARYISAVIPVLEFHLNTPLNHRDPSEAIYFLDQLNITPGVYVVSGRSTFGAALGIPVIGPRPYNVEATASFNFRY